ncbi:peptidoglycan endopeptidase LytF [Jejuia pallidilutea]|jgi:LysM repeat protein|uniref:Peptidoglycan endopeptidase LytF n=1 Tax=Jejuia pallidilutea TaxID=504487 RepID=A0A362X2K8_9FLAO|nr:LysM peptidoglycan-binding domain-containing protein [Jejuia pallidilutea]PQV47859.1 peptidoglycan endopeptidase LytF [Jejuia pallidilutea]
MQKSFKYTLFAVIVAVCCNYIAAQQTPTYKDVLLNGKPAKLNMATGEFILVNGKTIDTIKPLQLNSNLKNKTTSIDTVAQALLKHKHSASNFHIVKAGETLFGLSKKYGASLNELKKANNLETTLVAVGQKLRVKNLDAVEETPTTWTVGKGDTLYNIAKRHGITVAALKQLNALKNNTIYIGQKLRLK